MMSERIGRLTKMETTDARIEKIAARVRRSRTDGRIDPEAIAAALGIDLVEADLGDYLLAVTFDNRVVLTSNTRVSPARRRFAFGHEIGHALVDRGLTPWVEARQEEWWVDWFAHELVFPRQWLRERASWRQLQLFHEPAERRTIALHLAALNGSPEVFLVGEAVLCSWCGEEPFFFDCQCRRYREDAIARDRLPSIRLPGPVHLDQLQLFDDADSRDLLNACLSGPPSIRARG